MTPFTRVEGRAYPLPFNNIDTDLIIPAEHLKTIRRSGLGRHAEIPFASPTPSYRPSVSGKGRHGKA